MEHVHSHSQSQSHSHHGHGHHHHSVDIQDVNRAFVIGIILNFVFVIIEVVIGIGIHSLSLLSDAGHNLADVASLAMALIAIRLTKVKANEKFTYGYKKTTILVALLNAGILLISIGAISYEAVQRIIHPEPLPGRTISIVAAIGILINASTALLFFRSKANDLNVRSAFMHLISDAIVSAGLVVGGLIIYYTGIYRIDSLLSIVIAVVIVLSTWQLLKDSLRLSLDGVPEGIDLGKVRSNVGRISGVRDFHHIHVWAISTTENALTGHLVVDKNADMQSIEDIKHNVKHELEHLKINHATLEVETDNAPCEELDCD
ncbi:MAG TPA: cation diffusion facilitator family transporter [Puia sp.]|nr:cation diffusion facilitator family transporter [Puia sp.]